MAWEARSAAEGSGDFSRQDTSEKEKTKSRARFAVGSTLHWRDDPTPSFDDGSNKGGAPGRTIINCWAPWTSQGPRVARDNRAAGPPVAGPPSGVPANALFRRPPQRGSSHTSDRSIARVWCFVCLLVFEAATQSPGP